MTFISLLILGVQFLLFGFSWVNLIFLGICIMLFLPVFLPIDHSSTLPCIMTIDTEEGTVVFKSKERESFSMIDEIPYVYDYGEYYQIWDRCLLYFCQKDLLVQGTIEEFEKIFEGKIIRKY